MDTSLPVLIFVSRPGCPACQQFHQEWKKIGQVLKGKVNFARFEYDFESRIPEPFLKYSTWFPSILLCSASSFFSLIDKDGKVKPDYDKTKEIRCYKFAALYDDGAYHYTHIPATKDRVIKWAEKYLPRVRSKKVTFSAKTRKPSKK